MAGLDHVRWLGGATGAGKTTVARLLAQQTGVSDYSTDAAIAPHGARLTATAAPLFERFRQMSMDERWVLREPDEMYRTFPWFHGERFELLVEDLQALETDGITVVEGFRLLPHLVYPLQSDPAAAVWLISTPAFRDTAFATREGGNAFWRRTSDPSRAFDNLLARDERFATELAAEVKRLGLRTVEVDGSRSADEIAFDVAAQFGL